MDNPEKHAGYTHIAFKVNSLKSVEAQLKKLQIAISEGPVNFGENHGSSLFIRDPDKSVIEFHQEA